MYRLEIVSIIVHAFLLFIVLIHGNYLGVGISKNALETIFWIMAALFLFNTFGNIISKKTEKYVFTPITILMWHFFGDPGGGELGMSSSSVL